MAILQALLKGEGWGECRMQCSVPRCRHTPLQSEALARGQLAVSHATSHACHQETQQTPGEMNSKRPTLRHALVKLSKDKTEP